MMEQPANLINGPGQGEPLALDGMTAMLKAGGELTLGAFTVLECVMPPGSSGPARHLHRQTYEMFQVLEGELTLHIGERTVSAGPGYLAFVPLGVAHAFSNAGQSPVRFLHITSPGGYETYLRQLAQLQAEKGTPLPQDIAQELAERYDSEPA